MDLSPHVKDLITAYSAMPNSPRRERIIQGLQNVYLLATSDGLETALSTKSDTSTIPAAHAHTGPCRCLKLTNKSGE